VAVLGDRVTTTDIFHGGVHPRRTSLRAKYLIEHGVSLLIFNCTSWSGNQRSDGAGLCQVRPEQQDGAESREEGVSRRPSYPTARKCPSLTLSVKYISRMSR